jgi:3-oxoacid CoA-transferase A subunit
VSFLSKIATLTEAVEPIKDGDTIMLGGFGPWGFPGRMVRALLLQNEAKDLYFITNGPNAMYMQTFEKLLFKRSRGIAATFVRGSAAAEKLYAEGKLELVPQGTFAERLRAGGFGIPAFLTPVGVGTQVAEGKQVTEVDGKRCLLEKAFHADVALIRATKVDTLGNCYMRGSTKAFSALMPPAAKYTVVEAEEIVKPGKIDPELVTVPSIFVDAIVKVGD